MKQDEDVRNTKLNDIADRRAAALNAKAALLQSYRASMEAAEPTRVARQQEKLELAAAREKRREDREQLKAQARAQQEEQARVAAEAAAAEEAAAVAAEAGDQTIGHGDVACGKVGRRLTACEGERERPVSGTESIDSLRRRDRHHRRRRVY